MTTEKEYLFMPATKWGKTGEIMDATKLECYNVL